MLKGTRRALFNAGGGVAYIDKLLGIQAASLILLHPMNETSGGTAIDASPEGNDGAYTGVTLNNSTGPTGEPVGLWDGVNDFNNVYSAAFDVDFDDTEGSMACWLKVSGAGVWADATFRGGFSLGQGNNNYVGLFKNTTANEILIRFRGTSTNKDVTSTALGATTEWVHVAQTWSSAANEIKGFVNGAQIGATNTYQAFTDPLAAGRCVVGAFTNVPASVWDGYLAYAAVWKTPLTPAEVLSVATV